MRPTLATFLAGLLAISAQQTPPRSQQQNGVFTPTSGAVKIRTNVQLVVVDVSVKDKSGNPIEGLTSNDFTITEDGKPQDIKVFQFQRLEEEAVPAPALTPRGPQPAPSAPAESKPAAPPVKSVTANQIAPSKPGEVKYKDRRLLVMFFDMTSMPIQDQIRAQTAALKFLKTQMTAVRPDGHHDAHQRPEGVAGLHRRSRYTVQDHQEPDHRRRQRHGRGRLHRRR